MASKGRRKAAPVSEQLEREGYRFDFFQAVRLLRRMVLESDGPDSVSTGGDGPPDREPVRFRAVPTHTFPAGSIHSVSRPETDDATSPQTYHMDVCFLGLVGPAGVLPEHYTTMVIERTHPRNRDYSLRDFLDIFNHRAISLFYRAWEKYRFPFSYERQSIEQQNASARSDRRGNDHFTQALNCLVGLGTPGLQRRLNLDDEAILFYGGHFASQTRSAVVLENLVAEYFDVLVKVLQFIGQWLYLNTIDQTSMPSVKMAQGQNLQLGTNAIVGSRVWDVQGRFRLRIGPLNYDRFLNLIPPDRDPQIICAPPVGGDSPVLAQMTRLYAGEQFDSDVQLILDRNEVPECGLGATGPKTPRLGRNIWLATRDFRNDPDDAVFRLTSV